MNKKGFIFIITWFLAIGLSSQTKLNVKCNWFTTDAQSNLYAIQDHQIIKYNVHGKELFNYSNNVLGTIANVDTYNPLKILVFFPDFTKVVVLDDALSEWGEITTVNDLSLEETSLISSSYNNGIWFYNPLRFELKRIHENNITNKSSQLNLALGYDLDPVSLVEFNERLYMSDLEHGILVFDIYGTYLKTIPIKGLTEFQVKQSGIVYSKDSSIMIYNFLTLDSYKFKEEKYKNVKQVRVEGNKIYILNNNGELIVDKIEL